ncbi:MAG: hypothetical protein K6C94_02250 [Candidatus Gastranaerophilales bacterium]|nr:hypothetical protein [Candidatus Gastranaerophilales bacterium]
MTTTQYIADPMLTGISLAYTNNQYIADLIFKSVPVATESFKYKKYLKSMNLQLPETLVGETGEPNKVKFAHEKITASVDGHALIDEVSEVSNKEAAAENENLMISSTKFLTNVFLGAREKRIADLLQDTNTYSGNYQSLTSGQKFTNANVDAFGIVDDAAQKVWFKPNVMIGGRAAINALRRNPYVVKAANRNSGDSGKATLQDLKDIFELDNIFVGNSVANLAKLGQTANFVNTWGNDIILAYIAPEASLNNEITFGVTAKLGQREVSTFFNGRNGVRGVHEIKIAEQNKDIIVAPDCGYLIKGVC